MQKRTIAMMAVAGCTVAMLTGCGVKQEIHDATVTKLDEASQEIKALQDDIAKGESLLENKKKDLRTARQELALEASKVKDAKVKEAETAGALADEKRDVADLKKKLSSAKSTADRARKMTKDAEAELEVFQGKYAVIKRRWKEFENNLNDYEKRVGLKKSIPVAVEEKKVPHARSAMDLLDEL